MSEALLLALTLIDSGVLLILAVYFIITLSDLECDYLNASACCSKLNKWVLPEVIGISIACFLLLFSGHWILFIVNLPLTFYLANKYLAVSAGSIGLYDPTEIHNRGLLKRYMKESMVKLGYFILTFFLYLYSFVYILVASSEADS